MYIAHKSEDGREQPLKAHLEGVAQMASDFASAFGASEHAGRIGRCHDIGKYSPAGQRRMRDPDHVPRVDHSTAGAVVARSVKDPYAAFAIAGHHAGLMNMGSKLSGEGDGTLMSRLRKPLTGDLDYSAYRSEISVDGRNLEPKWINPRDGFALQFYTRMLFSCLVDADFIDTETFMNNAPAERGGGEDAAALYDRLMAHINDKGWLNAPKDGINAYRSAILRDCIQAGQWTRGLYTLTVPTGGGKTIASLAFALAHALKNGQRRVIYVIPYTSIIDQNAKVFADILGPDNVLEHHANVDWTTAEDAEDPSVRRKMLATENWDAPVVVTTAVQFFESLFANRTSRCRKLHNIANSVVIFDEAQMLPLPCLRPCVNAIAELVRHYNVTAVLCTATQPSLNGLFREFAPELAPREICPNTAELERAFRRVRYDIRGRMSMDAVASEMAQQRQTLCVVNRRKTARELFAMLPKEGRFHLSTRMTPDHRERVLEKIRARLKSGEVCRVVSTSLIEAGVDVDFPTVWREFAGLDSIIQAGGRCNREGGNDPEDSVVHVFELEDGIPNNMRQNATAAEMAIEGKADIDTAPVIKDYFDCLLYMRGREATDQKDILKMCGEMRFETVAHDFHIIDEDTVPIYIPTSDNAADLDRLRNGQISRALMRRLGHSAVSVYRREWKALFESGKLKGGNTEYGILADRSIYNEECGLDVEQEAGTALYM